jgi:hypothetical protein
MSPLNVFSQAKECIKFPPSELRRCQLHTPRILGGARKGLQTGFKPLDRLKKSNPLRWIWQIATVVTVTVLRVTDRDSAESGDRQWQCLRVTDSASTEGGDKQRQWDSDRQWWQWQCWEWWQTRTVLRVVTDSDSAWERQTVPVLRVVINIDSAEWQTVQCWARWQIATVAVLRVADSDRGKGSQYLRFLSTHGQSMSLSTDVSEYRCLWVSSLSTYKQAVCRWVGVSECRCLCVVVAVDAYEYTKESVSLSSRCLWVHEGVGVSEYLCLWVQ